MSVCRFVEDDYPDKQKVIRKLGSGGFGEVLLAEIEGQTYAVKTSNLNPDGSIPYYGIADLQSMILFDHVPEIIHAQGVCINSKTNRSVIYMDPMRGTLLDYVNQASYVNRLREFPKVLTAIVRGLYIMQSFELFHLDIKTPNILLNWDEHQVIQQVKISDFGLSREIYLPSVISGTYGYLSPEAMRASPFDVQVNKLDIWALGITLYEYLTKRQLFKGTPGVYANEIKSMSTSYDQPLNIPWGNTNQIPANITKIIQQMLTINPNKRPSIFDIAHILKINISSSYIQSLYPVESYRNLTIDAWPWILNVYSKLGGDTSIPLIAIENIGRLKEQNIQVVSVVLYLVWNYVSQSTLPIDRYIQQSRVKINQQQFINYQKVIISELGFVLCNPRISPAIKRLRRKIPKTSTLQTLSTYNTQYFNQPISKWFK